LTLPPLTKDFKPGWLKNLARQADSILVLIDLENDPKNQLKEIEEILNEWKIEKEKILVWEIKLIQKRGKKILRN
jgi:hypothetical protein